MPTFFSPLLGSSGSGAPAEAEAAAADAAAAWNGGERVVRAVGEATRHLGGAANGAGACARAVLAHVPVSNDMERRVSDAAADHLLMETARGVAAPPNARSLVENLTDELVRRMIEQAREVIAAVHVDADAAAARGWRRATASRRGARRVSATRRTSRLPWMRGDAFARIRGSRTNDGGGGGEEDARALTPFV